MPSAARIEGAAMIAALLPVDIPDMNVTIAARDTRHGRGISFTIHRPSAHSLFGEYRDSIVIPWAEGPQREVGKARLAQAVARHAQIHQIGRLHAEEIEACDHDPETGQSVEDDMPVPSWRIHAPLALRRALDEAGTGESERLDMFERSATIILRGTTVTIEAQEDERDVATWQRMHGGEPMTTRWITRASIRTPKAIWSQGKQRSYLRITTPLPDTVMAAIVGRSPAQIIDLPGLDAPGLTVLAARNTPKGPEFDISRAFSTLGPLPGEAR